MSNQTPNLLTAGLVLFALLASESALTATGTFPRLGADPLSAQQESSRLDEEQMFLEARRALSKEDYDQAAELFQALRGKYHDGRFVAQSYYWEAVARYRQENLHEALALLDLAAVQREARRYINEGGTQRQGRVYSEVRDLRLRLQRQLAERGEPGAAEEVLRQSEALLMPDTAALREMRRQLEARQREMERQVEARQREMLAQLQSQAQSMPDTAALREMQRQVEARQREMLAQMQSEQARMEARFAALSAQQMQAAMRQAQAATRTLWGHADSLGVDSLAHADSIGHFPTLHRPPLEVWTWMPQTNECEDLLIQQEAFSALLALETDRMPPVRSVLARNDECSAFLRSQAIMWLASEGTDEAEQELIKAATSHPDGRTRQWAISGLAQSQTRASLDVLTNLLGDEDADVQRAAVTSLWHSPHDDATDALVGLVTDDSKPDELRDMAASAVADRIPGESEVLIGIFGGVDSEPVKHRIVDVLARRAQDKPSVAQWLLDLTLDPGQSEGVRAAALNASFTGTSLDLQQVDGIYEQLEEADLRDRLLYALYRKAEADPDNASAVIDKMIELARVEADPEVRKRAVYWLGRTGSARAAEFLMEILRERLSAS